MTDALRSLALLVALSALPAAAQEPPQAGDLLVCYPNAPGNSRAARPVMAELGAYLGRTTGAPCQPIYFNELDAAEAWLQTAKPRFGIVSLALYLRWREPLGLTAIAASERRGKVQERYVLLVLESSPLQELGQLQTLGRPARIWSSHLDDRRFAARIVFAGALRLAGDQAPDAPVRLVSTRQPLRALRRMKKGQPFEDQPVDAVLVDEHTWGSLQQLRTFQGVLRVLYTAPTVPTPPVVAFPDVPPAGVAKLREAMVAMKQDPGAEKLLKTLQVTGFQPADAGALDALATRYAGKEAQ